MTPRRRSSTPSRTRLAPSRRECVHSPEFATWISLKGRPRKERTVWWCCLCEQARPYGPARHGGGVRWELLAVEVADGSLTRPAWRRQLQPAERVAFEAGLQELAFTEAEFADAYAAGALARSLRTSSTPR
jgi:hypothetical protein